MKSRDRMRVFTFNKGELVSIHTETDAERRKRIEARNKAVFGMPDWCRLHYMNPRFGHRVK